MQKPSSPLAKPLLLFVSLWAIVIAAVLLAPRHADASPAWVEVAHGVEGTAQSPPTSPGIATTETLGSISRTDGWCVSASTTLANAWTTAPTRITSIKNAVRFIKVRYSDASASADVCARLGPTAAHKSDAGSSGDPVSCDLGTETSGVLSSKGEFILWTLARDAVSSSPSSPLASPPPIWLLAASSTVRTCIDVGW